MQRRLNNEWYYFDFKGNLTGTSKTLSSSISKTAKAIATNAVQAKLAEPPLPMKGAFDPSLVGTWKYHSDAPNFNGYYIFRANGTYDYWSDMTSTKAPEPTNNNFWRVIGDELEVLPKGGKAILRVKMFKRNDPQNNMPALVIEWNVGAEDYRAYYPTEAKELWKINNASIASSKTNSPSGKPAEAVKLVQPPVQLNGNIDLSIIGLWKTTVTEIDYWLDFKPDGTYETWTSKNTRKVKCYWRIDKGFFESVCDGGNQKGRIPFKKINDLGKR